MGSISYLEQLRRKTQDDVLIPYVASMNPVDVHWEVFGDPETNSIFVKVTGIKSHHIAVAKAKSLVTENSMDSRKLTMHPLDNQLASQLATKLWKKHQKDLVADRKEYLDGRKA